MDALNKLVESQYCTVDLLKEYFKDFQLKSICLESHLGLYLQHFLSHHQELSQPALYQARVILRSMSDPLPVLKKLLQKTSPYDYAKLTFLLGEIQFCGGGKDVEKGLQLLRYLDKYTRQCPPGDEEKQRWAAADAEVASAASSCAENLLSKDMEVFKCLPEESQYRLPYHLLMNEDKMMSVIKKEIVMDSLDAWLAMTPIFNVTLMF
ncbi:kinetochore-associated protein 1 [Plakobranchus ocellatus]|uniref:Kinetochore-associated protein 1 n=1 Tax=Plakobranchus ocellatus TaxID=259542 RepID=A0AAV4CX60_9GAST|nr:kinetochore-associated protein 1 [Plakobranchus ocellatus]